MQKALLVAHGYLGDNIFISSVAQKLREENQFDSVDFVTGFPQVFELLNQNPYIDNVYMAEAIGPYVENTLSNYDLTAYDKVFNFDAFMFDIQPPIVAQTKCGVKNPSPEIKVWTVPAYDEQAEKLITELKQGSDKKVIAWQMSWDEKAYRYTEEEYWTRFGNFQTGCGTQNRNIDWMIRELSKQFIMIPVGVPKTLTQFFTAEYQHEYRSFAQDASVLKHCDYFIGNEGGMANLASSVGCKTILTYEFTWQLYGPRGIMRQFEHGPKLGPVHYFEQGHAYLPLYKSDGELVSIITNIVEGNIL
jgi:hypothetical protein